MGVEYIDMDATLILLLVAPWLTLGLGAYAGMLLERRRRERALDSLFDRDYRDAVDAP